MKPILAAATAAALTAALTAGIVLDADASGDFGPSYTMFRAWSAPDIPLERFQAGDLGVIQPGMRRVYLYAAWRAISLGPRVTASPGMQGGLARADGSVFDHGWTQPEAPDPAVQALQARLAGALHLANDDPQLRTIVACAPAATGYAAQVFHVASSRPDATPARLDAWVLDQQKVGEACQVADDWRYRYGTEKPPVLTGPAPLDAGAPLYWRQLNEYQRAAWAFQTKHYADSAPLFEHIGATPGHPMHDLGAYLALRAEVRRALEAGIQGVGPAQREAQALALAQRGDPGGRFARAHARADPRAAACDARRADAGNPPGRIEPRPGQAGRRSVRAGPPGRLVGADGPAQAAGPGAAARPS